MSVLVCLWRICAINMIASDLAEVVILFTFITFNAENDSIGVIDSCLSCIRPHTTHPSSKIIVKERAHTDF